MMSGNRRRLSANGQLPNANRPLLPAAFPVLKSPAMDEFEFRHRSESAMESLKKALRRAEDDADFEVEDEDGALHISFDISPGSFVVSPNSSVHQIWISALATSFKLDWSDQAGDWVLSKTGERLKPLLTRLMNQKFGEKAVELK